MSASPLTQPSEPDAYETVRELCRAGRFDEAARVLKSEHLHGNNPPVLGGMALLCREQGAYTDALSWADLALRTAPEPGIGQAEVGFALLALGRDEEAASQLSQAMLLDIPAAAVARLLLAETLFDRGDVAGALRCLEGASWDASTKHHALALALVCKAFGEPLSGQGPQPDLWTSTNQSRYARAVSEELVQALEIGRRDQARLLAQRLSRAAPEHADALVAVGAWHLHEQRLSDADRMFGEASYRRPSNARRLAVLQALLWSRQHRFADAIRKLDELPLTSLDSRALATLAECCRRTGQRGRAQKLAEQCLTQDASATQARAVLWYLAAEGDKVAPLAEAQEVLAQNPSDASALYFMADQLWSKTRTEALKLARRAAEADPLHPGAGDWSERLELGAHTPRRGNALTLVGLYAPKQDAGGAWPTPDQARLLELVFETPSDIVGAWNEWVSGQDIQDLDAGLYRLLPLAYRRLAEAGGSEASHFQLLAGIWRKSHYDNYNRWRKILPVLDRLIEDGVPLMPLKGGLFAAQLYADWGSRPMADIDLLIPLSQVERVDRLLREAGLAPQSPLSPERVRFHYSLNYKEPSGSSLDLHWRPMEEMVRPDYADDVVWDDSEPMMLLGRTFRKPSPTFQVVHAIVHGLRWNHVAPVRWVADAVLLLRAHGGSVDWRAAEDLARRFHFLLPLQKGLEYILHNFSVNADAIHASNILKAKPDAIEAPLFSIRLNGQRHRCSHHEMMTLANHYKPLVAASPRTTLLLIGGAQADLTRQWCARNKVPWLPEFEKTKVLQLLRAQGLKGAHCVHGNMNGKYAYQICA